MCFHHKIVYFNLNESFRIYIELIKQNIDYIQCHL